MPSTWCGALPVARRGTCRHEHRPPKEHSQMLTEEYRRRAAEMTDSPMVQDVDDVTDVLRRHVAHIAELESLLHEISASLTDGPDIGPELPRAVKSELGNLQRDVDMFRAEAIRTPEIKVKDGRLYIDYGPPVNDDMPQMCDFSGMSAICHKCGVGYPHAPMICPGRANYQIKDTS